MDLQWDYQRVTGVFAATPTKLELSVGQMATLLTLALVSYTDTYSPAISPARFTAVWERGHLIKPEGK